MKNRKTITLDQDILNISKALEPEERKDFFLQLVEHFLEDKQFPEQKQSYFNALIDPDVLILDDLGTEPLLKNVTLEYLYIILNERSRLGRLTVITTNLNIEGILKRYKERIFSRLLNKHESLAVYIDGEDLRLNKIAKRSIKQ